ncbi:hypothetical protein EAS64_10320 [Trebonia kvetii]|uniref:Uncharacterized protein n=1 Tax=Trebonia kvetii TaxID=2480626 RepID=A0A6P2C1H7_9ACTN|nr:hypothetical protein [Trebonia kvetii]TVZ05010.1 hypothetical protein EAS64_10320 [Trebonia kvetii]
MNTVTEKHEMVLSSRVESGEEEWTCLRCGRRLLLPWPPHLEKLVLDQGDVTAIHVGGTGGVRAGGITATAEPPDADRQWLLGQGIDWDGTSA